MTWNPRLTKAPEEVFEPWTTNERIWREWDGHIERRVKADNTKRNLRTYPPALFRMFDSVLITELKQPDMENFVRTIEQKCAKLMNGKNPQCLRHMDLTTCPMLTGARPATCPKYQALLPSGTWAYICAINRLYDWLLELGRVPANPMLPVMRDFHATHKGWFDERRRHPERRTLTLAEVVALGTKTPIQHAIGNLAASKCFLRIHEVLKLSFDPQYCNLDEGYMDIPGMPVLGLGSKRLGNHRIILDHELRPRIHDYREWWEKHVQRLPNGKPATMRMILTTRGTPWGKNAVGNYIKALHTDAIDLGFMDGKEERRIERINTHCFRAFAVTQAKKRKISFPDLQILRGDLAPGAIERYDDYLDRLQDLYRQFGPILGI
jgi:hypothetical protein